MKKLFAILFLIAAYASAQSAPARQTYASFGTPPTGTCADASNLGSFYFELGNPTNGFTGTYVCQQTGDPGKLGGGAFTWTALATQGTTPTTGTISVANGKAFSVLNSLTLQGTDATTIMFPATNITVPGTILTDCGSSASCATPTTRSSTGKIVIGTVAFSSATTATITGISPAFTGTQSYTCYASDPTHAAYAQSTQNQSGTSFIITSGTSNSDTWNYQCVGY